MTGHHYREKFLLSCVYYACTPLTVVILNQNRDILPGVKNTLGSEDRASLMNFRRKVFCFLVYIYACTQITVIIMNQNRDFLAVLSEIDLINT